MSRLLDWPAHRPRLALLLAAIATLVSLFLILRLRPETSLQGLLDPSDPAVVAMTRVLDNYPVVNELLVLATLPDDSKGDDPQALSSFAERLQSAAADDSEAKQLVTRVHFRAAPEAREFVEKVVVPNGLYYLDAKQLDEVMRRLTRTEMEAELARAKAMLAMPGPAIGGLAKVLAKDPLRLAEFLTDRVADIPLPGGASGGALLSPDRRSLLIRIEGAKSPNDFNFAGQLTTCARRLADKQNRDHLRIDIAGAYAMAAHSATRIQADSISDVVSTVLGLVILFVLACRRPLRLFWFSFLPVTAGMLWGFGVYALLRHRITPLAAVVGGTLGAIGLDYTIHYITHYQQTRRGKAGAADAVRETSRELFWPSLAAWTTSVIGFAAVAVSPVRVLRDFAILGTLSLIGAWLATLLVLPAMLARGTVTDVSPFHPRFGGAGRIGDWIARYARTLLLCSAVMVAALIGILAVHGVRYELNSDPMEMHPQPSPPLESQRFIAQRMQLAAGALIVHLQARSPEELVSLSHEVQRRLDTHGVRDAGISGVFGLASVLPDPEQATKRRGAIDPALRERAGKNLREALAHSELRPEAYEAYVQFVQSLVAPGAAPGVGTLRQYPQLAGLLLPRDMPDAQRIDEAVTLLYSRGLLESRNEREGALAAVRNALAGLPGATVTGTAVIGHDLETAMRRDLPRFVMVALACIALYLLIHFRSIMLAALALLPIAVSIVFVIAFVSLVDVKLNLIHAVAAPLLLGINLDYGIFAVHAWHTSRNSTDLSHHFPPAFSGLMMCGGSTIIGFGSLVITSIPAVQTLGYIVNIGVGTCVLSTLLTLWPALMLSRKEEGSEMHLASQSA